MGEQVNVVIHYEQWLKEVKTDLTPHSRREGDTAPFGAVKLPLATAAEEMKYQRHAMKHDREYLADSQSTI
jgi:hypothetical protein